MMKAYEILFYMALDNVQLKTLIKDSLFVRKKHCNSVNVKKRF